MSDLLKDPVPGIPMTKPEHPPKPGQVLQGYRVVQRPSDVFTTPKPQKMTSIGWVSFIGLALIFWPVSCIPCCLSCSYPEMYQYPVYG
jgi:hypothetical protein